MDWLLSGIGLLALGAGVGLVSSALGIGGGILMVPAFVTFVPTMDMNTAKGSSLFIIAFVAAYNAWKMNRGATRNPWDVIVLVGLGGIAGGHLGGWVTGRMSDEAVTWVFVSLLAFAGLRTFFLQPPEVREEEVRARRALSVIIGAFSGFVGGATGTGGGALLVPLALYAGIVSNEKVVALSNTYMLVTGLSAALAHFTNVQTVDLAYTYGQVNIALAPLVFLGAISSTPLGRAINRGLSLRRRRIVMGTFLLFIAIRLVFRVF